jgi:hypothetical protein
LRPDGALSGVVATAKMRLGQLRPDGALSCGVAALREGIVIISGVRLVCRTVAALGIYMVLGVLRAF